MSFEPIDLGHPDANRTVNFARAELDDSPPVWWYLSFADDSWLGGCYVKASNEGMAVMEAHRLGCNPGGEVAIIGPLSDEQMDENTPPGDRNRLLTAVDLD